MKLLIVLVLSTISYLSYGLSDDSVKIKNSFYRYKIINQDTTVIRCQIDRNDKRKTIDSIKIYADIIIENLPLEIESADINNEVIEIMNTNNLSLCYVFRDLESSSFFRMSSRYASQLLNERKGFIGEYKNK
jgi:hypothetical protein